MLGGGESLGAVGAAQLESLAPVGALRAVDTIALQVQVLPVLALGTTLVPGQSLQGRFVLDLEPGLRSRSRPFLAPLKLEL